MKFMRNACKNYTKIAVLAELIACLLTASSVSVEAQAIPTSPDSPETEYVRVYVNGEEYAGRAVLYEDTTYVDMNTFANVLCCADMAWNEENGTASVWGDGFDVSVPNGAAYICANGRYLWCPTGVFSGADYAYVPLRAAAKIFGADVGWSEEEFAAYVTGGDTPLASGDQFYDEGSVYWLSRIIFSEAGIEPFGGQIAVGNVVLNRVRSDQFPGTIYEVIFDRNYGVQFTPTANGSIYCDPDEEAIIAAKLCLEGYTYSEGILYFLNPELSTNFWVPNNREYVMTIAGHDFYS
jgi:N-acetylmuramoyl-L-alanine amidase